VRRAVMAPVGVMGLAVIAGIIGLIYLVSQSASNAAANANEIHYVPQNAQVFPATFQGPSAWNYDPQNDSQPFYIKASDSGGRMYFVIRRVLDSTSLQDMLNKHFQDETGLNTTGFPDNPPPPSNTKVAGQSAIWVRVHYSQGAENDEQDIYCFAHDGVGYVITYVGLGDDAIKTTRGVADTVNSTLKFNGNETPPPAPSPTPGESPSATP
jgi:hypothetical protein